MRGESDFEVFICGETDERVGELAEKGRTDAVPEAKDASVMEGGADGGDDGGGAGGLHADFGQVERTVSGRRSGDNVRASGIRGNFEACVKVCSSEHNRKDIGS